LAEYQLLTLHCQNDTLLIHFPILVVSQEESQMKQHPQRHYHTGFLSKQYIPTISYFMVHHIIFAPRNLSKLSLHYILHLVGVADDLHHFEWRNLTGRADCSLLSLFCSDRKKECKPIAWIDENSDHVLETRMCSFIPWQDTMESTLSLANIRYKIINNELWLVCKLQPA